MTVPSVNSPTAALSRVGSVIAVSNVMCGALLMPRYRKAAAPVPSSANDI